MFVAYNNLREEQDKKMINRGMVPLENGEFMLFMRRLNFMLWNGNMPLAKAKAAAGSTVFLERIS